LTEEREHFVLDFKEENDELKNRIRSLESELDLIQHEYDELLARGAQRARHNSSEGFPFIFMIMITSI
jgi:hypothetical protein